ncbi:hypothetical protein ACHAXH_008280 [Discostella pseudostelligera]|jgi:SHAQKYF class myb-like DNA-binding protein
MAPSFVASDEDADMMDMNSGTGTAVPIADATISSSCLQLQSGPAVDTHTINSIQFPIEVFSSDHPAVYGKKGEPGSSPHRKSRGRRTAAHKRSHCSEINTSGRWTAAEHNAFLRGLKIFGREWKKVVTCIPTRTSAQIRSHAQKYFAKQSKEHLQQFNTADDNHPSTFLHCGKPSNSESLINHSMSKSIIEVMNSIANNPSSIEIRVCATLASLRERHKALEERLHAARASPLCELPVQSENAVMGPATAALAQEQKSLRKAAEARYELKKRQLQLQRAKQQATPDVEATSCALVSLASMRSYGGFDSRDVIALSMLGGNLGKESITWSTERSRPGHE